MLTPRKVTYSGAAVYIPSSDGRVLAISRGQDTTDWSLPGGHRELGERLSETAARELREETGIDVDSKHLRHLVENVFYIVDDAPVVLPARFESKPFEGYVDFVTPDVLLRGRHGQTFERVLRALHRRDRVRS